MEADCETLSEFVTPGEAGRIRARLAQMGRCWEELRERVEQLGGQLNQSASYRQRYNDNLEQVRSNPQYFTSVFLVREDCLRFTLRIFGVEVSIF